MHFKAFSNSHRSSPSPHPTNSVGRVYPEFFSSFSFVQGGGRENCKKISKSTVLRGNREMTEKYKIAVLSQGLLFRIVDLGDWSCRVGNLIQPIRSTTQIQVMTRHQYGTSALVSQTSFGGETSGSVAKCRLFSQANKITASVKQIRLQAVICNVSNKTTLTAFLKNVCYQNLNFLLRVTYCFL